MTQVFQPHDYQIDGIHFLLTTAHAGLVWKPGLGKTVSVLTMLKVLKDKGMLKRALIVAPKQVATNVWPDGNRKWRHTQHMTVDVLHGPKKEDILARSKAEILVVTPEGLDWLVTTNKITHGRPFEKGNVKRVLVD